MKRCCIIAVAPGSWHDARVLCHSSMLDSKNSMMQKILCLTLVWKPKVCCHNSAIDREIDRALCRERAEAEERQMDGAKKRLNDNFIDFVHEHEEEIGDPTEFATSSENKN